MEVGDDLLVVIGHFGYPEIIDMRRVLSQGRDVNVHTRPALGDDGETLIGVALNPAFPALGGKEEPVDQHNGVRWADGMVGHGISLGSISTFTGAAVRWS